MAVKKPFLLSSFLFQTLLCKDDIKVCEDIALISLWCLVYFQCWGDHITKSLGNQQSCLLSGQGCGDQCYFSSNIYVDFSLETVWPGVSLGYAFHHNCIIFCSYKLLKLQLFYFSFILVVCGIQGLSSLLTRWLNHRHTGLLIFPAVLLIAVDSIITSHFITNIDVILAYFYLFQSCQRFINFQIDAPF